MVIFTENSNYPREGYFWIIDDKVIGYAEEVPKYNYEYSFKGKTHENTWNNIKSEYLVDGKEVEFDYYPRGRVMVDPNYKDNEFYNYSVLVFMDPCIGSQKYKDMVANYYNLNLKTCPNPMWMTSMRERTGINHYTCHNCREE